MNTMRNGAGNCIGIGLAFLLAALMGPAHSAAAGEAQARKLLCGFESVEDANKLGGSKLKRELAADDEKLTFWLERRGIAGKPVTEGAKAAKFVFPKEESYAGLGSRDSTLLRGWEQYEFLKLDVFNPDTKMVQISVRIDDARSGGDDYTTWYNGAFNILPGANTMKIPLKALYTPRRKGTGHRGRCLDPKTVKMFCFWTNAKGLKKDITLYLDNLRLENEKKTVFPASLKAFDMGPENALVWPGFTKVTEKSKYDDEKGYGFLSLKGLVPYQIGIVWPEAYLALDGDGIWRGWLYGREPMTFAVKLDPGKYRIWGSAGPLRPRHAYTIKAGGKVVASYSPPEPGEYNPATDPVAGDYTRSKSLWAHQHEGTRFFPFEGEFETKGGRLDLVLEGVYGWLRAVIIHPVRDAEAKKAADEIIAAREKVFMDRMGRLEQKPQPVPSPKPTAEEKKRGFMLAVRDYSEKMGPHFTPRAEDRLKEITIAATPGEHEPAVFIAYPLRDVGKVKVSVSDLKGAGRAVIPSNHIQVAYVRYEYYQLRDDTWEFMQSLIVPRDKLMLEEKVARQFWLTVKMPDNAAAGTYVGRVTVSGPSGDAVFPLRLKVYPFKLKTAAECGLILAHIFSVHNSAPDPWQKVEADLRCLAEHGMNSATLSAVIVNSHNSKTPRIVDGRAVYRFGPLDKFMEIAKKVPGMTGPFPLFDMIIQGENGGHSFAGLGELVRKDSCNLKLMSPGYLQAITDLIVQLLKHATEKDYLPVLMYSSSEISNDEYLGPEANKKLIDAMRKAGKIEVVSSVNQPKDIVTAKYLDHIMVNYGTKFDMEKAKRIHAAGAKLWFQNIGAHRFGDGLLMIKTGAIGRRQYPTKNGRLISKRYFSPELTLPRINLKWIQEGNDDQRYYYCLKDLIAEAKAAGKAAKAVAAAEAEIKEIISLIPVSPSKWGVKTMPDGLTNLEGFEDKSVYDKVRQRFVNQILALRQALGKRS